MCSLTLLLQNACTHLRDLIRMNMDTEISLNLLTQGRDNLILQHPHHKVPERAARLLTQRPTLRHRTQPVPRVRHRGEKVRELACAGPNSPHVAEEERKEAAAVEEEGAVGCDG